MLPALARAFADNPTLSTMAVVAFLAFVAFATQAYRNGTAPLFDKADTPRHLWPARYEAILRRAAGVHDGTVYGRVDSEGVLYLYDADQNLFAMYDADGRIDGPEDHCGLRAGRGDRPGRRSPLAGDF